MERELVVIISWPPNSGLKCDADRRTPAVGFCYHSTAHNSGVTQAVSLNVLLYCHWQGVVAGTLLWGKHWHPLQLITWSAAAVIRHAPRARRGPIQPGVVQST